MYHSGNAPTFSFLLPFIIAAAVVAITVFYMRSRGYSRGGGDNVIVRCRQGHLFTTIWMPLASFKAVRLGPVRFQYCPVGRHWTFVGVVDPADLTDEERRFAAKHHDIRIP